MRGLSGDIRSLWIVLPLLAAPLAAAASEAEPNSFEKLQTSYREDVRPLLKQFCVDCHSAETEEGNLDLDRFVSLDDVRKDPQPWRRVAEMLDDGEMPPDDNPQPTGEQKRQLRTWVQHYLDAESLARAGDPGPVVLRRLSNAEYTYTLQDLTGVALDPAREFPVDGAAGEGFTNTGYGQGMSPALVTKYLDAAKKVADHAVILPDGIRFSVHTTRRDHTDDLLARIRDFYARFTSAGGGAAVNLQGIQFETNQGGLLPVEKYLAATIHQREGLAVGKTSIEAVARERSLNARYLGLLWNTLSADDAAGTPAYPWMDELRRQWRNAKDDDAVRLGAAVAEAQQMLWKFNPVGHIGREGGPKSWMEPVVPITTRQELRFALPDAPPGSHVVLSLGARDLGDGNEHDFVIWERPRFEFKADANGAVHPPVLLRDTRDLTSRIKETIAKEIPRTAAYLQTVGAAQSSEEPLGEVAARAELNPRLLERWRALTGIGVHADREIHGHFTTTLTGVQGYETVNGWGSHQTPSLLTNRSDEDIQFLTLTVPARGVTVHPSPQQDSIVAWRSPIDGKLHVEGLVADADNKCGNGAAWRLELHSRTGRSVITGGLINNGQSQQFEAPAEIDIRQADVVSLIVRAHENNHSCDTTHIALKLTEVAGEKRTWDLSSDVVDRVLKGNPLADSYGHADTWHFCAAETGAPADSAVVPGSALARWREALAKAASVEEISQQAAAVQAVLTTTDLDSLNEADRKLRHSVHDWRGPLRWAECSVAVDTTSDSGLGLDPSRFGTHPNGSAIDTASLCLQAPHVMEVRLPAALVAGAEFVANGLLHAETSQKGSVQLQVQTEEPDTSQTSLSLPVLVAPGSSAQPRIEAALTEFRELFPPALCYTKIVPVDEVVTLTLFYREDDLLKQLMLDDAQTAELDRLWDELFYVSQEPIALTAAYEQLVEFASQTSQEEVRQWQPLGKPIQERADAFRRRLVETEPAHVEAVLELADRAWRRPLSDAERQELRDFYQSLRESDIPHPQATRLMLARVLSSPAFLYKLEQPPATHDAVAVTDLELATRLSYFLWSSQPDEELRQVAEAGRLTQDDVLLAQTRRMLEDPRTSRLAVQFACQWLHLRDFDQNDDKNEQLYPQFATLRGHMYEETVRFFQEMFQTNDSILTLLDADHTFLNAALAAHYGIDGVTGDDWRRVDGLQAQGRGGILSMATFLASQSGASRTSPILRGNWVYETLLGERLPRPPANVPQLPEAVPSGLTARELIEQHSSVPECARCHAQIDPYGFALEQFDAIGRLRSEPVDTRTTLVDGTPVEGVDGLRTYLLTSRRDDVVRQFCRKLLGFALGREVLLSDERLLDEMQHKLGQSNYRFHTAVETIVTSDQFRKVRGRDWEQHVSSD